MTWTSLGAVTILVLGVFGCDPNSCDDDTVAEAVAFLDAHQSCETNDDCAVVFDSCGTIPGGFCGQLAMNREGATSARWKAIEQNISECAPTSCEVCDAALVPTCNAGSCRSR
jgi:hypothetical protein